MKYKHFKQALLFKVGSCAGTLQGFTRFYSNRRIYSGYGGSEDDSKNL